MQKMASNGHKIAEWQTPKTRADECEARQMHKTVKLSMGIATLGAGKAQKRTPTIEEHLWVLFVRSSFIQLPSDRLTPFVRDRYESPYHGCPPASAIYPDVPEPH